MNYFKLLFFYFISVFDAIINFACALIHYYPSLEMAQDFLLAKELQRIGGEIQGRNTDKLEALAKADALMEEAQTFREEI
jgi:hypothetical protein